MGSSCRISSAATTASLDGSSQFARRPIAHWPSYIPALSPPRVQIRRNRYANHIDGVRRPFGVNRLQELHEEAQDASLRATAGCTPFVPALQRIRPAPGGRWAWPAPQRRARPGAEVLDSRLLMTGATASTDLADRVAQALQPYFAQGDFPGISVAIVTDGQVALEQGYGASNAATRSPVQANTRFDIGSVTKTFTALGVLLLYQESQGTSHPLNLNAPISDYLHNAGSFKLPPEWPELQSGNCWT